jgi:divalent metal cation (Fe/Co/Zn/Cd) transporter
MTASSALGARQRRVDSADKITGVARYTADLQLPGMVHGRLVLSPFAHAKINRIDSAAALRVPGVVETHNITVLEGDDGRAITLHVRLDEGMAMRDAAPVVERLKQEIRSEFGVARVYAHVEPSALGAQPARDVAGEEPDIAATATRVVRALAGEGAEVVVYRQGERLLVVTSLRADPSQSVREAHNLASRVEDAVRDALDSVDDVIVEVLL